MTNTQTPIPCVMMRGGTSRGPYFLASDLPDDPALRDRVLLAVMGSPDPRQIDGIGGADSLTSKVAVVGPSTHPDADVDYLFAQVGIDRATVDTAPSCGNILSGVGPFAIEAGLVPVKDDTTLVTVHNVNTGAVIETVISTPGGRVNYDDGDTAIDGVPGTAAPIVCRYFDVVGSKTGQLLPTGKIRETIQGVEVTCIDVAMPMVMIPAAVLDKRGDESKAELDADHALLARIESIRREAGERMGLGDVSDMVIPKVALLSRPRHGGSITSRYFVPHNCHAAHAVTGALCVATCAVLEGSVADGLSDVLRSAVETVVVEHPSGRIEVELAVDGHGSDLGFRYGGVVRTARRLFEGQVLIPASVWSGRG